MSTDSAVGTFFRLPAGWLKVSNAVGLDHLLGAILAIIRGLGIGVISETEYSPHSDLHALSVTDADMYTRAYLVCLESRHNRPLIQDFLSLATRLAKKSGYAQADP